ncbi:MAG: S9 family peptidase [Saprospiraceae bacterium]|nr:S9 family peptidase [Saprospiraceae bacterium]MCF8248397.1 S9 family peptidase [Saprospiraceae bacterium]MCF8280068.1 S9 family peptidase [Bacteroidales bacterium]MCF8309925.1 S9 family peptidase [Saprospiraceae bacterium]MCF8438744.1 S9 family peptidase [Saprospiraceae bacterium]
MSQKNTNTPQLPGDASLPSSKSEIARLYKKLGETQKYAVEDFFRLPKKSRYQLSPDGNYFAYLGPFKRRLNIFVQKTNGKRARRVTEVTDRDIAWFFWKDNRIVFGKDEAGDENFHIYSVSADGNNLTDLTPFAGVRIDLIDDLEDIENEIIISMNKNNPQLFEPYRLNITTGEIHQLAENPNPIEPLDGWMTDHDGKLRIANKISGGTNATLLYRPTEDEPFRPVLTTDFRESISPLFFDFENEHQVYVASNLGRDRSVITKLDLLTGKEVGEPLFTHEEVDVTQLGYSRKRRVLTSIVYTTAKRQLHFLDDESQRTFRRLEKELGDYEIFITGMNKAEDKMMVRTYSDRSLGAYYFFDKTADSLTKIVEVSPWLDETDMAPMKPISFQTSDGLAIHGYLTLPKDKPAKNLPIILNPHGGPWVRDNWGFNPEIQLLASRGYGVLQLNYRGSTGYGRKFWECSFKQWGKKMQDDLSEGVQWLVKQGIANPKRVAIYGGSYGGYATLAGVTFTPGLYACAIDYVGVSNLFTFMNTIPPYWKPYLDMMYEMVGNPEKDKDAMYDASPVFHIDKIKCPLFVVQGANDPRVNIDESDQIVAALRKQGVEVLYMVKYDEGHGFHNEENRFEMYKAMLGFLGKNLGQKGEGQ